MDYKVVYTPNAEHDLDDLSPLIARKILKKVRFFLEGGEPLRFAKKLKGLNDYFRFRVGDYRVIFRQDAKSHYLVVLVVLRIGHRKAVYRGSLL